MTTETPPAEGSQQPPEGQQSPPAEPDREKSFWERFDKTVETAVDRVVEKRLKGFASRPGPAGTQRTDGRPRTIPEYLHDFMFGAPSSDK